MAGVLPTRQAAAHKDKDKQVGKKDRQIKDTRHTCSFLNRIHQLSPYIKNSWTKIIESLEFPGVGNELTRIITKISANSG